MEMHDLLDRLVRQELAARATAAGAPAWEPTLGAHLTLDEKQHGRGQEYLTVLGAIGQRDGWST